MRLYIRINFDSAWETLNSNVAVSSFTPFISVETSLFVEIQLHPSRELAVKLSSMIAVSGEASPII